MKNLLFGFLIPASVFAANCEVGGISDSPQSMSCEMTQEKSLEKLSLTCKDESYQIEWKGTLHLVTDAYHEDVEEGSSPLVFVSEKLTLRTRSLSNYSRAQLLSDGKDLIGKCYMP